MLLKQMAMQNLSQMQSNGFTLAITILVLMIIAVLYSLIRVFWITNAVEKPDPTPAWRKWLMIILFILGMLVALYLTYVETLSVKAVCGPVGDCNAVQTSKYARLFGVLPVGLLGLGGYVTMLVAYVIGLTRNDKLGNLAHLALFGMALFGVIFSIYLTYLEPFVIKAVCMWCLSSSVIMTLILLNSLPETEQALNQDLGD
ncbi:MAG: vitamin K epoxide reductase family protein [Candidatus Kryptoniota bacterium]